MGSGVAYSADSTFSLGTNSGQATDPLLASLWRLPSSVIIRPFHRNLSVPLRLNSFLGRLGSFPWISQFSPRVSSYFCLVLMVRLSRDLFLWESISILKRGGVKVEGGDAVRYSALFEVLND